MTMDTSTKKKWVDGENEEVFKNGMKFSKNGNSYSKTLADTNGNNSSDKEIVYKNDILECSEEKVNCGIGPCSPKWLQVQSLQLIKYYFIYLLIYTIIIYFLFNSPSFYSVLYFYHKQFLYSA